jgi:hypothetical protein
VEDAAIDERDTAQELVPGALTRLSIGAIRVRPEGRAWTVVYGARFARR